MERTDAFDLKEIANEFTVIETSGTDVSLGSFNQSCHPGCGVQFKTYVWDCKFKLC